jgi:hypothetical protein
MAAATSKGTASGTAATSVAAATTPRWWSLPGGYGGEFVFDAVQQLMVGVAE